MTKERGGTGRYVETTPLTAVLDVFDRVRGPVVTSADVSDALDCSRDTARRKLTELHEEGRVERRETAARVVWWLPESDTPDDPESELRRLSNDLGEPITVGETVYESGDSHPLDGPESGVESGPDHGEDSIPVESPDDTGGGVSAERAPESVDAVLDGVKDLGADQRAAVRAMYEYLREYGTARKGDFTEGIYPEHPAGYGSSDGWWNRLGTGSTGPEDGTALADLPGVEKPPAGRPVWHYSEESNGE